MLGVGHGARVIIVVGGAALEIEVVAWAAAVIAVAGIEVVAAAVAFALVAVASALIAVASALVAVASSLIAVASSPAFAVAATTAAIVVVVRHVVLGLLFDGRIEECEGLVVKRFTSKKEKGASEWSPNKVEVIRKPGYDERLAGHGGAVVASRSFGD